MTKILVADNDREFRELVIFALRFAGLFSLGCSNAEECLIIARQDQPDLILLGDNLGNINAEDVCKTLQDNEGTASIAIVFLSAKGQVLDNQMIVDGCGLGIIDKRGTPDQITKQVIRYLRTAGTPNP